MDGCHTHHQIQSNPSFLQVISDSHQLRLRVKTLVLVTTLLDAELYSREDIAETFRHRWHVELDLRSIKQTMNMSVLRCKSPDMVRKEIFMRCWPSIRSQRGITVPISSAAM
jgi:CTP synthase (UTP-ammonia lyase)